MARGEVGQQGTLSVLIGPVGSGKSTIASHVADAARARGDRVGWGSAWPSAGAPPLWHWRTASASLGLPWQSNDLPAGLAGRVLGALGETPRSLVVLDDVDVADDSSLIVLAALTRALPGIGAAIVATATDPHALSGLRAPWRRIDVHAAHGLTSPVSPSTSHEALMADSGHTWSITTHGQTVFVPRLKGMAYLAALVAHPGQEIHAIELAATTGAGVKGTGLEVADRRAVAQYRQRVGELAQEVDEATDANDLARAALRKAELDQLTDALVRALGLGGRTRRTNDPAERARLNVSRALRSAIDRVTRANDKVGWHLVNCVKTGLFCSYRPERGSDLRLSVTA